MIAEIDCDVTLTHPLRSRVRTVPRKGMMRSTIASVTGEPERFNVLSSSRSVTFTALHVLYLARMSGKQAGKGRGVAHAAYREK
jgi:hypothetical protein